ncbi:MULTISPECIES: UDP binding domain-containing protein [unclassified Haloferax]|uniref:UDP binding domain-containing protein n=1 Tax=unclassified Haloferax TaxID=2625095 RepID=UPI0002B19896|nr:MULTISPECIES: UDP binding domain-containing protein [unclassified Haloferax]ELZ56301.1 UDP-glucose 6-dehydrogenase [Haloferax sp. ATCC BAA-646]ELZ67646.1 UDP-glucose 6-dehydrogenase [Haloferax sp. ATCC BAA-645]ELZ68218.1 UDP-glucose 6-dehydrogenase [Haloferax sp. ATCC BAA-644]
MELSVIGSGYVGTTIAACFADLGHTVVNVDIDTETVDTINRGEPPIHEDGLPELIATHAGEDGTGRLRATTDYSEVLETDVTFLCLPTPQKDDGEIDLSIMEVGAEQLGETLAQKSEWHTVVVKSTVVPGTTEEIITPLLEDASGKVEGEQLGIGMNPEFLRSGLGWGGSCFPKDTNSIIHAAKQQGYTPAVLEAAVEVNDNQPERLLSLLDQHVDVADQKVAVLGLAFKPGTDDIRNSRAISVIQGLKDRGASIAAYGPVATANMREHFPDIEYADSAVDVLADASACVVCTDWDEFEVLDEEFDQMEQQVVVDGRHVIEASADLTYEGLTW